MGKRLGADGLYMSPAHFGGRRGLQHLPTRLAEGKYLGKHRRDVHGHGRNRVIAHVVNALPAWRAV